jgi:hypothetical protein
MAKQVSEIENPMAQVESQSESLETTWIDQRGIIRTDAGVPAGWWGLDAPDSAQIKK